MMRRSIKSRLLMLVGALLLVAALGLSAYNLCDGIRAERAAEAVAKDLVAQIATKPPEETPDYITYPEKEMPLSVVGGTPYIGYLEIPDLGLTLPVAGGEWSEAKLKSSPCLYAGSVYRDDMIIGAHNYRNHFGKLTRLAVGATVRFIDTENHVFEYTVGWNESLSEYDTEGMLTDKDWDLTLFTCNLGRDKRYTLRCIKK